MLSSLCNLMDVGKMFETDATNLPRLMACNGSRSLAASLPPVIEDTSARDEGNAAHYMAQAVFRNEFTIEELIDRKANNGIYMTPEMAEYVGEYLDAIMHRHYEQSSQIEIETSFSGNDWRVNARADHIGLNVMEGVDCTVYVDDFKYGWRIVEPQHNWTLIAHAIGYCIAKQITPRQIVLTIHQPRPYHPEGKSRSWSITWPELLDYYNQIVAVMSSPSDELHTGNHCRGCRALATCPAARVASMNAIDASEMAFDDNVDNPVLSFEIDTLRTAQLRLNHRLEALEELAKHRLKSGQVIDNYGLEIQLANTSWITGLNVEFMKTLTGVDLSKPQLMTPGQAKKKGIPEEIIKPFTERRQTGVKLVRRDASKKAEKIFGK